MLHLIPKLSRWFGSLGLVALCATVAAPVRAEEEKVFAAKEPITAAEEARREGRIDDIQDAAATWHEDNPNAPTDPVVRVGGIVFLRFRAPAGGYSAIDRQAMVQSRLVTASSGIDYQALNTVRTTRVGQDTVISLRGHQLVTVTSADAAACNSTTADLARSWAGNLRRGLANLIQ